MIKKSGLCQMFGVVQKTASIWLLISFLLLMYFPAVPVNSIPIILFTVVCLTDWPKVKNMFKEYKLVVSIVLFALTLGVLLSCKPQHSIKGIYDFLRGAVIFFPALYLVREYPEKVKSSSVWVGLFCSFLYLSYVIFAVFFVSSNWEEQRAFLADSLGHYNTYGTSFALIVFVAVAVLLLSQRTAIERYALLLSMTVGAGLLLFSGSRGSVVALFVGIVVLMLIRFRRKYVLFASLASMAFLALWGVIYFNLAGSYLRAWVRGGDVTSGRLKIYTATLTEVWQHAKLFGFGPNTYKYLDFTQVLNSPLLMPHSVYLECFFSLGIVGTLLLAAAFFILLKDVFAKFSLNFFTSFGFGLAFFLLTRGLVDMKLFGVYYPGALAVAFAFMLAGTDQPRTERQSSLVAD